MKRVTWLSQVTPLRSVLTQGEAVAEQGGVRPAGCRPPEPRQPACPPPAWGPGMWRALQRPHSVRQRRHLRGGQCHRTAEAVPRRSGMSLWAPGARPSCPLAKGTPGPLRQPLRGRPWACSALGLRACPVRTPQPASGDVARAVLQPSAARDTGRARACAASRRLSRGSLDGRQHRSPCPSTSVQVTVQPPAG